MMTSLLAVQSLLFDLDPVISPQRPRRRTRRTRKSASTYVQRLLWLDIEAAPAPDRKRLPRPLRDFRGRLKDHFSSDCPDRRTLERGQLLMPMLQRVDFMKALCDGAFRLFVEYRPEDKLPHYRLLWGHLFFGRVDIHLDTNTYGADFLSSATLPTIQHRLAGYLIALGIRPGSAHLDTQDIDIDESDDDTLYNTDTREYRLFKINIERAKQARM